MLGVAWWTAFCGILGAWVGVAWAQGADATTQSVEALGQLWPHIIAASGASSMLGAGGAHWYHRRNGTNSDYYTESLKRVDNNLASLVELMRTFTTQVEMEHRDQHNATLAMSELLQQQSRSLAIIVDRTVK